MKCHHLDLVRATEAGAISAAEWVGRGDKESADLAATEAMRYRLNQMDFVAEIAIGEGKKDESHGLYEGEIVGANKFENHSAPEYDIAIDPIEGTTPTVKGGYEAMSVMAIANKGCLFKTEHFYMDKIAVGPEIGNKIDINNPASANIAIVAAMLGKSEKHVTVCVIDRPRTSSLVGELREIGCRIKFISDCDVTACIAACEPDSGIDMYWSVGGAPEAVIAAAAMKCMGGYMQCKLYDKDGDNIIQVDDKIYTIDDLAKGPTMFAATGITDGKLLDGVRFTKRGPITNSIAMRSESGTIRRFETEHGN